MHRASPSQYSVASSNILSYMRKVSITKVRINKNTINCRSV